MRKKVRKKSDFFRDFEVTVRVARRFAAEIQDIPHVLFVGFFSGFQEEGVDGYCIVTWVRKGTPKRILNRIYEVELEIVRRMTRRGIEPPFYFSTTTSHDKTVVGVANGRTEVSYLRPGVTIVA